MFGKGFPSTMPKHDKYQYRLKKKSRKGFRGYPVATIGYYGPDNRRASKVAVGIVDDSDEVIELKRWFAEEDDVR
jgi:hypothetical protein